MASPRRRTPDDGRRGIRGRAIVWKRFDFRESSRILALFFREHGVVHALAKGAHRPNSPLLGRVDFLSDLDVSLSTASEGLRTLLRADLVRERRSLRDPARFLAASHLAAICDAAAPQGQPEPEVFDLADHGLVLLERCPKARIAVVVLGLEVRLLQHLGVLPDLDACADCGRALQSEVFLGETTGALACRDHAAAPRRSVGRAPLQFVRTLRDAPGRAWPELDAPALTTVAPLVGRWLERALERRCPVRAHVFAANAAKAAGD